MTWKEVFRNSFKSLGQEIGLDARMEEGRLVCKPLDPQDPRYAVDFILPSMKMVSACRSNDFDFFQPALKAGLINEAQILHACERYHLGKTKSGQPIFWMIDDMQDPLDAHIGDSWISYLLKAREPLLKYWRVQHCLFGLHLLYTMPSDLPISIVEHEASAVILSELFPESIWMAYTTITHVLPDLLDPLEGRTVTIFPSTDNTLSNYVFFLEYSDLIYRTHLPIDLQIDPTLEDHATQDQKERGIDILDFILEGKSQATYFTK